MRSGRSVAVVVLAAAVASGAAMPAASAHAATLTKAHAKTIAKRINFHAADFPGYKVHPYQSSKAGTAMAKKFNACAGLATPFAQANSATFDNGSGALYSSVTEFVSSRATAKRDVQRAATAKTRRCLKQELATVSQEAGATNSTVTLTPITETPVEGLDAISGLQYTVTFTIFGFSGTLHGWDINFSRGNSEVSLNEVGTANVPEANLHAPLATLVARAEQKVPAAGLKVG
jgi:hypothetical protein